MKHGEEKVIRENKDNSQCTLSVQSSREDTSHWAHSALALALHYEYGGSLGTAGSRCTCCTGLCMAQL